MTTLNNVNQSLIEVNKTLATLNRPQTGTLAIINQVTDSLKITVGKTNIILDNQQRQLAKWDSKEEQLFNDINIIAKNSAETSSEAKKAVIQLNNDLLTANDSLLAVNQSLNKFPKLITDINSGVIATNNLLSNPSIPQTLTNVSDTTKNAADISGHFSNVLNNSKKLSIWDKIILLFKK